MQILDLARPTNFKRLNYGELADAANNGDSIAAYMCTYVADNGMGVIPVDEVLAVDRALQGMELSGDGGILCQAWLGMKLSGISLGANPDAAALLKPTISPLQKMAEKGNLHAKTMLGVIARHSFNVMEPDYFATLQHLESPVRLDHPEALMHMGFQFDGGIFPKDKNQQRNYYQRAAELQHAPAQAHLALWHQKDGANRKLERTWLEAATKQQFPLAMQLLGEWHYTNKTINGELNPNLPEAFKLWRAAAERGVVWAAVRVAECYEIKKYFYLRTNEDGNVVDGSMAQAYKIYSDLLDNNGQHVYHRKLPENHRRAILANRSRIEGKAERIMVGEEEHLCWTGQGVTAPRYSFG